MLADFYAYVSSLIEPLQKVDYAWDEWEAEEYFAIMDEVTLDALEPVSRNALMSFGTAISVWVYRSLEGYERAPSYYQFLSAAAASTLEEPVLEDISIEIDEWRGPEKGPFAISMISMTTMLHDHANLHIQEHQIADLKTLFCHIRPSTPAFEDWFDASVAWLAATQLTEELRPKDYVSGFFDTLDFVGYPVPLTAFVPGKNFNLAESKIAFEEQKQSVRADNPFINY